MHVIIRHSHRLLLMLFIGKAMTSLMYHWFNIFQTSSTYILCFSRWRNLSRIQNRILDSKLRMKFLTMKSKQILFPPLFYRRQLEIQGWFEIIALLCNTKGEVAVARNAAGVKESRRTLYRLRDLPVHCVVYDIWAGLGGSYELALISACIPASYALPEPRIA